MRIKIVCAAVAAKHLKSLSKDDRYTRFCTNISDEGIDKYVANAKGVFYGVFVMGVGMVDECVSLMHFVHDMRTREVEIALSTSGAWKGNGFAERLLTFGVGLANAYAAKNVVMTGLDSNKSIIGLGKKCGFEVEKEYGEFSCSKTTIYKDVSDVVENNFKFFRLMLDKLV